MKLKTDIISAINPKNIYGKKGEEVMLISDLGTVCIVEDKNMCRFPVKREELEDKTKTGE